jgi:hypothetical protein
MPTHRITRSTTDTTVAITFRLTDPIGLVTVESDLADSLSHDGYLALLRETGYRLEMYAQAFEEAVIAERQLALTGV